LHAHRNDGASTTVSGQSRTRLSADSYVTVRERAGQHPATRADIHDGEFGVVMRAHSSFFPLWGLQWTSVDEILSEQVAAVSGACFTEKCLFQKDEHRLNTRRMPS
jgi:hypothetical protein